MSLPIIVSALLDAETFRWLDGLRRAYFPADRNIVPAHLTLFHHLPPSAEQELGRRLSEATKQACPQGTASGVIHLGRGVAIRIDAPRLAQVRADLADAFEGLLIPQDAASWRAHVTVQNKVAPAEANAVHDDLASRFQARVVTITGLACWWYRDGPWELIKIYQFR